ncbi:MAG: MMPL family transporter [Chloroflexi bacterium]|nr:MMPL family transporter [Chloroflexota bacterium]
MENRFEIVSNYTSRPSKDMLYKLGLLTVRFRWAVIALWIAVFLAALILAPKVTSALKSGFGDVDTEARRGLALMTQKLQVPEASFTIVFHSPDLKVSDPKYVEEVKKVESHVSSLPEVSRVVTYYNVQNPYMVSSDGHTSYAIVLLKSDINTALETFPALRKKLPPAGELQMWATGGVPIFSELTEASERDLRRAETLALPLVLVALVIVFGSVVAAGLPLAMGVVSIVVTLALVYLLAQRTDMSIFVLNIASFLGLGMAIDYSLLIVSRFREELATRSKEEAIAVSLSKAGMTILFSGITSALGLSGLIFFKFTGLRSIGIGGVSVILMSMVLAMTLLPAILGVLGHRVNSLRILPQRASGSGIWHGLAQWVMRHPLAVAIPIIVALLILGLPFLRVNLGAPWASILSKGSEPRQGWEFVEEKMGSGELAPILLVATSANGIANEENIGTLYDFASKIAQDGRVNRVESIVSIDPRITKEQYQKMYLNPSQVIFPEVSRAFTELTSSNNEVTLLRVISAYPPMSEETKALVRDIRRFRPEGGVTVYVSGATADLIDSVDRMYQDFPKVIIFVIFTTYVALLWLFRSVVLPLKAILMNTLSILASYGALVFIFQEGHFQRFLGFPAEGNVEATVPILMFCILFGVSMDYEVFLLSRIKEEYEASGDNTRSVALGLERTGLIITSAALILVLVASAFATGDIVVVKALGFGIALAIFIDATIVRTLLVPALMRLLGNLNWWAPAFLKGR